MQKQKAAKPKIKVLIFDGAYKFGTKDFAQNKKAAIAERDKFYKK